MRAQFFRCNTPTPVKSPKMAIPKKKIIAPSPMARASAGIAGPFCASGRDITAQNPSAVPSKTKTLQIIATTPATVIAVEACLRESTMLTMILYITRMCPMGREQKRSIALTSA